MYKKIHARTCKANGTVTNAAVALLDTAPEKMEINGNLILVEIRWGQNEGLLNVDCASLCAK